MGNEMYIIQYRDSGEYDRADKEEMLTLDPYSYIFIGVEPYEYD